MDDREILKGLTKRVGNVIKELSDIYVEFSILEKWTKAGLILDLSEKLEYIFKHELEDLPIGTLDKYNIQDINIGFTLEKSQVDTPTIVIMATDNNNIKYIVGHYAGIEGTVSLKSLLENIKIIK